MKKIIKFVGILLTISLVFSVAPTVGGWGDLKLEPSWTRIYDSGENDYSEGVATDSNNNVIVIGTIYGCAKIIKYDSQGKLLWIIEEAGFDGNDVATDRYNNIIVTGGSATRKYNPDGKLLWVRKWSASDCNFFGVAIDSNNNVLVTGLSWRIIDDPATLTIKYDEEGDLLWVETYDTYNFDCGTSVTTDSNNNVIVTGYFLGCWEIEFFRVIKYDSHGKLLWTIEELGAGGEDVVTDYYNNIIVVIESEAGGEPCNFTTRKYDPNGKLLWARDWSTSPSFGADVTIDSKNNIIATGRFAHDGDPNNHDILIVKYDQDGDLLWAKIYDSGGSDGGRGVATDSKDKVIVTGTLWNRSNYDLVTIKYGDTSEMW